MSVLGERTNVLEMVEKLNQHGFKSIELASAVPVRAAPALGYDATSASMTGLTYPMSGSDTSGLVVDPDDKNKAQQDLLAFKDYISSLKFAYLESDMKLRFVSHVLDKDGCKPVSQSDQIESDSKRATTKAALRERKARAAQLEKQIKQQADMLDGKVQKLSQSSADVVHLLRECDELENELLLLKSKRPHPVERTTIEEARALCDDQLNKMSQCGPALQRAELQVKETKSKVRSLKHEVERATKHVKELQKQDDERRAKGFRDEKAEADCAWVALSSDIYKSVVGIRSVSTLSSNRRRSSTASSSSPTGSAPSGLVIEYEHDDDDVRTLSISIDPATNMFTGAKLVNSSIDIQDIVQDCLPRQAIRTLVQEVRARISR